MRRKLAENAPHAIVIEGTAEAIPLETGSLNAVVVATAFHWFDGVRALAEIHRVLKPGGHLGLVWNARDESVDWVAQLTQLIDPHQGEAPRYRAGLWRAAFEGSTQFTPFRVKQFHHVHRGPPQMVVDRVGSISFVAALPAPAREQVLAQVRHLLATHPATRGLAEIDFPYRTDTFVCSRKPRFQFPSP
jgi:SAM-dependent methyltransferase